MLIATDPLSLLFLACFFFGLLFLLVAALLGSLGDGHAASHDVGHSALHHIDMVGHGSAHTHVATTHVHASDVHVHGHQGDGHSSSNDFSWLSIVNPTSVVLFLLGFGFFGYFFHNTTAFALPLALTLAFVGGIIIAALLLWLIQRVFGNSEGATVQDVSDRVGLLGKVISTIPAEGLGEVIYVSPGGMRKSIPARSTNNQRIERDQEVVVINFQHGVAEVDTWDHFVNQEDSTPLSHEEDLSDLNAFLEDSYKTDSEYVIRNDVPKE